MMCCCCVFFACLLGAALQLADARLLDTSVACDQNNFILALNFDVPFRGLVYSEEGFPNCVYVNGTMLSHITYQLKIPLRGCETRINGDGNFENGIIIQENVAFLQSTDKKYLLTCIPSSAPTTTTTAAGPVVLPAKKVEGPTSAEDQQQLAFGKENAVTVDFGGVTVDQSLASTERVQGTLPPALEALPQGEMDGGVAAPAPAELKYTVEIRQGHAIDAPPVSNALNIGDQISYVVRLQKPVSESQIGRCWASDSKSSLELSDDHGCSMQPKGNIWGAFEREETASELLFINKIKAWAFPTSNEVNIFCNLRVCMSRHCSFAPNCTESPHLRKRREGADLTEVDTLKTSIRLREERNAADKPNHRRQPSMPVAVSPTLLSLRNADEEEDAAEEQSWCMSLGQLLMLGACCSVASVCVSLGAAVVLFSCYCGGRMGAAGGDKDTDSVWSALADLARQPTNGGTEKVNGTARRMPVSRSRHAI